MNEVVSKSHIRFMTASEVEQMPPTPWLIKDILPMGSLSILCGDAGTGKSFLALDWALCIATGTCWQGREVKKGQVVYIAAEGISGLGKRIRAWKKEHKVASDECQDIFVVGQSVQLLHEGDIDAFVEALLLNFPEPPRLLVIDTLARCMVGGEENGARDMGLVIQATEKLRAVYQGPLNVPAQNAMHIIFIHHTPKGGKGPRGHSSLRGAADVVVEVTRSAKKQEAEEGDRIQIRCDKQKDADAFKSIYLLLKEVSLPPNEQIEIEETSCILVQDEQFITTEPNHKRGRGINRRRPLATQKSSN